jgi:Flp pilus assembly protein TadD
MMLNKEFKNTLEAYERKGISADQAVERLLFLWEHDSNFFEIANNIAVLYAQKGDVSKARHWIHKAGEIMIHDQIIDSNSSLLVKS